MVRLIHDDHSVIATLLHCVPGREPNVGSGRGRRVDEAADYGRQLFLRAARVCPSYEIACVY